MLDHLITDDGEEENQHLENIRKMIEDQFTPDTMHNLLKEK